MEGILLIDKPKGMNSFKLVSILRKRTGIKKIGHAGTLDPLASGLMILLVGRNFTRQSDSFLGQSKEYETSIFLGAATTTYDADPQGEITHQSEVIPTLEQVESAIATFQGDQMQIPPMYSAKKIGGKKLYDLARQGKEVERAPQPVHFDISLIDYCYPHLKLHVKCSKGTYIRSLAHDLGVLLGTYAHLSDLRRTHSGHFTLDAAHTLERISEDPLPFVT